MKSDIAPHPQPPATPIQAVIFDLDGVLMDSEWMFFRIWQELAAQHGGRLEEQAFSRLAGTTMEETAALVTRLGRTDEDLAAYIPWVWQHATERLAVTIEPLPGAIELVHALKSRGYPLGIASNSITPFIDSALDALKLDGCFRVRIGIDQVASGKPASDVYLRAAEALRAVPERCLAVEDSRTGVRAAAAAGMRVIAVPGEHDRQEGFEPAWRIFPSLVQALAVLDSLLA